MTVAGLVKSKERFDAFHRELDTNGCEVRVISFDDEEQWRTFDFGALDLLIYYPSFQLASSHPLALRHVNDHFMEIHRRFPHLPMYPDPCLVPYYSDKARQHLFLSRTNLPVAKTLLLENEASIRRAEEWLKFPMVVKNRFGAGGDYVYLVHNREELAAHMAASNMRFGSGGGRKLLASLLSKRTTWRGLFGERDSHYPLPSPPLLAQEFLPHEQDLKTVVGDGIPVEFHWRRRADAGMWKMNIDGGAVGEWSHVPPEPLDLSVKLAKLLGCRWLNTDLILSGGKWYISEFSPVWHHYGYKEKPSFVYKDDYNGPIPIEEACNLERLIVRSYLKTAQTRAYSAA
jgi:hypothetical protein